MTSFEERVCDKLVQTAYAGKIWAMDNGDHELAAAYSNMVGAAVSLRTVVEGSLCTRCFIYPQRVDCEVCRHCQGESDGL